MDFLLELDKTDRIGNERFQQIRDGIDAHVGIDKGDAGVVAGDIHPGAFESQSSREPGERWEGLLPAWKAGCCFQSKGGRLVTAPALSGQLNTSEQRKHFFD